MDLGWLWLVLGTFFTLYSFYAWKENSDNQWKQLGLLGIAIVALLVARLFLIDLFPESARGLITLVVWLAWIPTAIALALIVLKGRKNR